ncbi:armadillo-type protein [Pavlovales sp. CCMP2436]|nr:armadillo-type protein [Pavlovales sp. CCMP2436]
MSTGAHYGQLERHLHELRSRSDDVRLGAARGIRSVVAQEARELPSDIFAKLIGALSRHIFELAHAHDAHDRQSGVLIIEAIIDIETDNDAAKLSRFATCLHRLLEYSTDAITITMSTRALGRLARLGGSVTADFVEVQLKLSLEWLASGDRVEGRRLAAALVLRELADNVPTLFSLHVGQFLAQLWHAVYDPKAQVREAAVAALAACLRMIGARSTVHAAQWHVSVANEAMAGVRGARAGGSSEAVHGALCALGELLRHRCDHLHEPQRFALMCALAREHFGARDRLVRRALVALVARLSEFDKAAFASGPISELFPFVLNVVKAHNTPEARAHAFEAAGEIALAVGARAMAPYLPELLGACADALPRKPSQKRPYLLEAVTCVGRLCLACADGELMRAPLADGLLEGMLHGGLTPQLVEALLPLCARVPALAPRARAALLHLIAVALTGRPSAEWLGGAGGGTGAAGGALPSELVADERDVAAAGAGTIPYNVHAGSGLAGALAFGASAVGAVGVGGLWHAGAGASPVSPLPTRAACGSAADALGWGAPPLIRSATENASGFSGVAAAPIDDPLSLVLALVGNGGLAALPPLVGAPSISAAAVLAACGGPAELHTRLALRTLGSFPWPAGKAAAASRSAPLFATAAARYLDDARPSVRAEALVACYWQLARAGARERAGAHELLARLVTVGVADTEAPVRVLTLRLLPLCFEAELARASVLRTLLFALNDEDLDVRIAAVALVAKVAPHNPAVVMPILRRVLLQLVTDIGHFGASRQLDGSVRVLGGLLSVAAPLMAPYTRAVLDVLRPKLDDPDPAVAAAVLRTAGALVDVGGVQSADDVRALCPPLLAALSDPLCVHKRSAALGLLCKLVRASAQLQVVLEACPRLLPLLVSLLKSEREPAVRAELLQAVGILGALDPRAHRAGGGAALHEDAPHAHGLALGGSGAHADGGLADGGRGGSGGDEAAVAVNATGRDEAAAGGGADGSGGESMGNPYAGLGPPDAHTKVAVEALSAILRDPSISAHHLAAATALTAIFERLRTHALPFVATALPLLIGCVRTAEVHQRDAALERIVAFVRTVGLPVRPFLRALLQLVDESWAGCQLHAIGLVEALAGALGEFARAPLQSLAPKLLTVLHLDASDGRAPTLRALRALRNLGAQLGEHTHTLVPALMRLAEAAGAPLGARAGALRTLAFLTRELSIVEHASRVVQTCHRLLAHGPRELQPDECALLCLLAAQMGDAYLVFAMAVQPTLNARRIEHAHYQAMVGALVLGAAPPPFGELWAPVAAQLAAGGSHPSASQLGGGVGSNAGSTGFSAGRDSDAALAAGVGALGLGAANGGGVGAAEPPPPLWGPVPRLPVDEPALQRCWQTTERSTADDWSEWMRRLSVELLRESPSPALRACAPVASVYPQLARSVFNCGFVSCWSELRAEYRQSLVQSLETALAAEGMPTEVLQLLLNLAEFMEHDDRTLPIDVRRLGDLAMRCHAYAQALHYKELEFEASAPAAPETVEALIAINNQLQQPEAARGVIVVAQRYHGLQLDEGWNERLQRWEDALGAYEAKLLAEPRAAEALVGRARCLHALGEWRALLDLAAAEWPAAADGVRAELAPFAAAAAWHAGEMAAMREYAAAMDAPAAGAGGADAADGRLSGGGDAGGAHAEAPFFRAVLAVHAGDRSAAAAEIRVSRLQLDPELTSLVGESYTRAFRAVVKAQQLAELEEIAHAQAGIAAALAEAAAGGGAGGAPGDGPLAHLTRLWSARLALCQRDVDAWQQLLAVRRMVLPPRADARTWLKLASLARQNGRLQLSKQVLFSLLEPRARSPGAPAAAEDLHALDAAARRESLVGPLGGTDEVSALVRYAVAKHLRAAGEIERARACLSELAAALDEDGAHASCAARCWRKLGEWASEGVAAGAPSSTSESVGDSLGYLQRATALDPHSYKAWHRWAMLNFLRAETDHREKRRLGRSHSVRLSISGAGSLGHSACASAVQSAAQSLQPSRSRSISPPFAGRRLSAAGFGGSRGSAAGCALGGLPGNSPIAEGVEGGRRSAEEREEREEREESGVADGGGEEEARGPTTTAESRRGRTSPSPPSPAQHLTRPRAHADERREERREERKLRWSQDVTADVEGGKRVVAEGVAARGGGEWAAASADGAAPSPPAQAAPSPPAPSKGGERGEREERLSPYVVPAVVGFFRSIALGGPESLQDLLRLLTLWFRHGGHPSVIHALEAGFSSVPVGTWLAVIPQVIARLDTGEPEVRRVVQQLLCNIALEHPQAFIYPLTVAASEAQSLARKMAAQSVLAAMRHRFDPLIEHARLVSCELMRVAILLPELWLEALDEASRLWFRHKDARAMLATLRPMHALMKQGPQTGREVQFFHQFAFDLDEALSWCAQYERAGEGVGGAAERFLDQAWEIYYKVLSRIHRQLGQLTKLDLAHVSPALHAARDLVLAVPGTYKAGQPVVCIRSFHPELTVISSKQRPRKLEVYGDDGRSYAFLLKGHEDLRQDERVMQLIGLVNQLLAADKHRASADGRARLSLAISQYAVVPLSPNSGLIGWVVQCDTLHALICDYREARKILLNIEHRLLQQMAPNYELCTLLQKVGGCGGRSLPRHVRGGDGGAAQTQRLGDGNARGVCARPAHQLAARHGGAGAGSVERGCLGGHGGQRRHRRQRRRLGRGAQRAGGGGRGRGGWRRAARRLAAYPAAGRHLGRAAPVARHVGRGPASRVRVQFGGERLAPAQPRLADAGAGGQDQREGRLRDAPRAHQAHRPRLCAALGHRHHAAARRGHAGGPAH